MKRLCTLLLLLGCTEESVKDEAAALVGDWTVTWTIDDESAEGIIHFNNDYSGNIVVSNTTPSAIIHGDHYVDVTWEKAGNLLTLVRTDNAFELNYTVISQTDSAMSLTLFDDIYATMQRLK